jgi:hypothetical protein
MSQHEPRKEMGRLSRRAALRAGAAVSAIGAGLGAGTTTPALGAMGAAAQDAGGRMQHVEVDAVVGTPVSIVRAGNGPPQRGDWFFVDAVLYEVDGTDGPALGNYQCFGAWTHAGTEANAPNQRLTSVQFSLAGRGSIVGLINEAGADPSSHVGAVQGGTGEFAGVLGTFRQVPLTTAITGVTPGQPVFRGMFDLILPDLGQQARRAD